MTVKELDEIERGLRQSGFDGFPIHDALRTAWVQCEIFKNALEEIRVLTFDDYDAKHKLAWAKIQAIAAAALRTSSDRGTTK